MIKATDLRIGNKVYDSYNKCIVDVGLIEDDGINRVTAEGETLEFIHYEALAPITLTPEIVRKCGFEGDQNLLRLRLNRGHIVDTFIELDEDGDDAVGYEYHVFLVQYNDSADFDYILINTITSLHVLQNLYFALTGEELDVKL